MLDLEGDGQTIGKYLGIMANAHLYGVEAFLRHASGVLLMTSEKYQMEIFGTSFFENEIAWVDNVIELEDKDADIDYKFVPVDYDFVTNTVTRFNGIDYNTVPNDVSLTTTGLS